MDLKLILIWSFCFVLGRGANTLQIGTQYINSEAMNLISKPSKKEQNILLVLPETVLAFLSTLWSLSIPVSIIWFKHVQIVRMGIHTEHRKQDTDVPLGKIVQHIVILPKLKFQT